MATEEDFSKLTGDMYRQWEKAMTTWWDDVLESPAFLKAMGDGLANTSQARKAYTDAVDKTMSDLHLPSRKDVVRVAKMTSLLEEKILTVEDKVLEQGDRLVRIEKDALKGRIDTAETLLSLQEKLASIEERLDRLTIALESPDKNGRKAKAGA